jgi:hypothetical protein
VLVLPKTGGGMSSGGNIWDEMSKGGCPGFDSTKKLPMDSMVLFIHLLSIVEWSSGTNPISVMN